MILRRYGHNTLMLAQTRLLGRVPWQGFPVDLPVPGRKLSNTQQFPTLWEKMQENRAANCRV